MRCTESEYPEPNVAFYILRVPVSATNNFSGDNIMKNTNFKKLLSLLLCMVLIAATALTFVSCTDEGKTEDTTVSETTASEDTTKSEDEENAGNVLGEGKTVFNFTVRDIDGTETAFEIHTDAKTVGEALVALELIEGEDSQYGLYVKKVNGITADYDVDGTYWAFYVNGEYAMSGVDTTDIEAGATYMMAKSK
jgi:hypothetical protein